LLTALADVLLVTEQCAFLLEFGALVSIATAPYTSAADVDDRLSLMSTLVSAIPSSVRGTYQVTAAMPEPAGPPLTAEQQQQARRIVDAMPTEQRRQLMARMRTEGPDVVIREVLADPAAGSGG
jgi:hypothetical protein